MNVKNFADQFGISAIARRHFAYRKPVTDDHMGGYATRGALTYTRALDRGKLGLAFRETQKAFNQGQWLAENQLFPNVIIVGDDQRNWDGGLATAEAIREFGQTMIEVYSSPAVTYPHYTSFPIVKEMLATHEDYAVHRYLAGQIHVQLWSESPETFEARIAAEILTHSGFRFYDLNFEQITLLYFKFVKGLKLADIPYEKGTWMPTMGGGIVISDDRKIAREFNPDFTLVD